MLFDNIAKTMNLLLGYYFCLEKCNIKCKGVITYLFSSLFLLTEANFLCIDSKWVMAADEKLFQFFSEIRFKNLIIDQPYRQNHIYLLWKFYCSMKIQLKSHALVFYQNFSYILPKCNTSFLFISMLCLIFR